MPIHRSMHEVGEPLEHHVHGLPGRPAGVGVGKGVEIDGHRVAPVRKGREVGCGKPQEAGEHRHGQRLGHLPHQIHRSAGAQGPHRCADGLGDQRLQPRGHDLQGPWLHGWAGRGPEPLVIGWVCREHGRRQGRPTQAQLLALRRGKARIGQDAQAAPVIGHKPGPGRGHVLYGAPPAQGGIRGIRVAPDLWMARIEGGVGHGESVHRQAAVDRQHLPADEVGVG